MIIFIDSLTLCGLSHSPVYINSPASSRQ